MPRFEIEANGKRYEVEAPSREAALQALGANVQSQPPAPTPPSQLIDDRGSILDPIAQGLTFGFADEMRGGLRGGARYLFGDNPGKSFGDLYNEELAGSRANLAAYRARHPYVAPAAEVGGAIASIPYLPLGAAGRGAGMGERIFQGARSGAVYGGLYGAGTGEGVKDRLAGGAAGAAGGAIVGAVAPALVGGVQAAARGIRGAARRNVTGPVRGLIDRDREASRRIGLAIQRDRQLQQPMLTPAEEATARISGQPVFNLDRGGETLRGLARASANASPEGRIAMETAVSDRFAAQGDRTMEAVRRIVGGRTNVVSREGLLNQSRLQNAAAYRRAYEEGANGLWSPQLERLSSSPAVANAIRGAVERGKNRAVSEGFGGFNPTINVDPSGIISFTRKPNGVPTYPDLQFWDYVRRELSDAASAARRGGRNEEAGAIGGLAAQLNQELDRLVPSYAAARSGAARFFGAQDAIEAGEQFVTSRMANDEARAALSRMGSADRQLFAESFADTLVRRIAEVGDRRNVINSMFLRSPASQERIEIALGPARARELEAFLRVEDLLDRARTTFGNSTTTRQLVELGLIGGGAGTYGTLTGDWHTAGTIIGGLLLKKGMGRIDRGVAMRVGQMLASPDPAILQRGLQQVAMNDRLLAALRTIDLPLAVGGAQIATRSAREPLRIYLNAGERDQSVQ